LSDPSSREAVGRPRRRVAAAARLPGELEPDSLAAPSRVRLLNVGYGNLIVAGRVVAVISPQSSPMRRLRRDASERGKLIDTTEGRRTRSILVTDSDHVILSAINPETIAARLSQEEAGGGDH
jgi:regulator of extracellular matrix RemA (YlzA/DUF370 family)